MKKLLALILLLVLVACPSATTPTPPNPGPPQPPVDNDSCTNILSGSIDLPTTLVDTPAACDYLLEGVLQVGSTLSVEPGVVVRATLSSRIVVKRADLLAVGTPERRIVFEGLEHTQGYWGGIYLNEARPSRIEYVDIKDGGQTCQGCEGGLQLSNVVTSLTNSSVSNSFVNGLYIDDRVEFSSFANNRFYGNAFAGVVVEDGEIVDSLDKSSDYLGVEQPNGLAYVNLRNAGLARNRDRAWKTLNAPYYIWSWLVVSDGSLTLEPGVEMIFRGPEYNQDLELKPGAELIAVGTSSDPVIFRGERAELESWTGIELTGAKAIFKHVQIRDAYRGVTLRYGTSTIEISESSIANSIFGIGCSIILDPIYIKVGANVTFETTNEGLDDDCTVEPF